MLEAPLYDWRDPGRTSGTDGPQQQLKHECPVVPFGSRLLNLIKTKLFRIKCRAGMELASMWYHRPLEEQAMGNQAVPSAVYPCVTLLVFRT